MPALTKSRLGSSAIRDAEGTTVCVKPWRFSDSKKRSQRERISEDSTSYIHPLRLLRFLTSQISSSIYDPYSSEQR